MTLRDLYLLSPEASLAGLAVLVLLLDLGVRSRRLLAWVSVVGLVVPFLFSLALWGEVSAQPGGQVLGAYNTVAVDRFALFFKVLVLSATALVFLASQDYLGRLRGREGEFYALVMASAVGMMLLAGAVELISLYIALELSALPAVALSAMLRDPRSTEAGVKFLVLSALSSAVLLYGMAFTYGFAGTTHLPDIARAVQRAVLEPGVPFGSYALLMGVVLMAGGFGFKIASVPFQMWVPDVYQGAPTPITAFLSVASKSAGFAGLLRVFYGAFGALDLQVDWALLFAGLAVASMTVGNLGALVQTDIKRLLAYSTVAHAGYLLVGLAAVAGRLGDRPTLGLEGLLFYLGAYTVTNLCAFFAVIALANAVGGETLDDLKGMGRRAPLLGLMLTLALVSLTGIPPTAVFWGKFLLFSAAVKAGLAWLALVGVVNSVVSAYYYLRVVRVLFLPPPPAEPGAVPATPALRTALALTSLGVLVLGVLPVPLLRLAETAARVLAS